MAEPVRVVLMGVAGAGKSTVGPRLADALGVGFVDADALHAEAAKAQMAAGRPLDDATRAPWLDRVHDVLATAAREGRGLVLACSALKTSYRRRLRDGVTGVVFVALVAPPDVLAARLAARPHHFADEALLPSQLHDLELDDDVVIVDGTQPVDAAVADAVRELQLRSA